MDAETQFDLIVKKYSKIKDCHLGKMMSSPGLKYKDKVFAFYWKESMGFKLGKDFDIDSKGVKDWTYLSPFKTKPPLMAWYILPKLEAKNWDKMAKISFEKMKKDMG